jgi:hypothetical protein
VLERTLKQTQHRFNVDEVTRTDVAQCSSHMAFVGRESSGNEKNKPPQSIRNPWASMVRQAQRAGPMLT